MRGAIDLWQHALGEDYPDTTHGLIKGAVALALVGEKEEDVQNVQKKELHPEVRKALTEVFGDPHDREPPPDVDASGWQIIPPKQGSDLVQLFVQKGGQDPTVLLGDLILNLKGRIGGRGLKLIPIEREGTRAVATIVIPPDSPLFVKPTNGDARQ